MSIDKAKTRGFRGVPEDVWKFHIGGYQVCEKWLKDRQAKGRKTPAPGKVEVLQTELARLQNSGAFTGERLIGNHWMSQMALGDGH